MYKDNYASDLFNQLTGSGVDAGQANLIASFALAQARHESADFTSDVFVNTNNAIGYKKFIGSEWQSDGGLSGYNGYAVFPSLGNCAGEHVAWILRHNIENTQTITDYVNAVKAAGYFEDTVSNYLNGCTSYYYTLDFLTRIPNSPLK